MSRAATIRDSVTEALDRRASALVTEAAALEQIRQHLAQLPAQIEAASATSAEALAQALEPLATSLAALTQETGDSLSSMQAALQKAREHLTTQSQQQAEALTSATKAMSGLNSKATEVSNSLTAASRDLTQTRQTLLEGQRHAYLAAHDQTRRLLYGAIGLALLAIASPWAAGWWSGSLISPRQLSQQAEEASWGRAVGATWQTLPPSVQTVLRAARERQTAQP